MPASQQHISKASSTTWGMGWRRAPRTWSARPRARCCKGEIPVQFHFPELNSPMRTGEKVGFVPRFVPRPPSCYPPFCPCWGGCRKFFRHIPSAPRTAAPAPAAHQHDSSTTTAHAQQHLHALELRKQMPSVLRESKLLHPGPRTLVCEPDKGVTFTFLGIFVGTFWIFRASS